MTTLVTDILLGAGVLVAVIACLGVALGATPFDRLHFVSTVPLAGILLAAAVLVHSSFSLIADKALLLALFLFVASPLLAHATGRVLRARELGDWRLTRGEQVEVEDR